ncbi:unannotated protein [freshwater metagenome]|uniref:Unannotated protein n=1 Tax=freshwater metagenome TaxID=449393 RepID=A0A6J6FGG3_9ZZZZ
MLPTKRIISTEAPEFIGISSVGAPPVPGAVSPEGISTGASEPGASDAGASTPASAAGVSAAGTSEEAPSEAASSTTGASTIGVSMTEPVSSAPGSSMAGSSSRTDDPSTEALIASGVSVASPMSAVRRVEDDPVPTSVRASEASVASLPEQALAPMVSPATAMTASPAAVNLLLRLIFMAFPCLIGGSSCSCSPDKRPVPRLPRTFSREFQNRSGEP